MSKRPRGIFDYAPKAAARNRSLLPPEDDAPGFFSASLEDVYKKKYGGRYPGLAENVASGAATGLKAIGVPKHVAETTGRNITDLAEWTPFGMLTSAEHLPEAISSGNAADIGLTALGTIPIVGGKAKKAAKVLEALPAPGGLLAVATPSPAATIRAYHGSPYHFDKFDPARLGTGEGGANAGRGINLTTYEPEAHTYINPSTRWGIGGETVKKKGPGHVYEVDIGAGHEQFVDLDAPLNKQPQDVQDAVREWSEKADRGSERRLDFYIRENRDVEERLAARGYKGLTTDRVSGNRQYTVFDPSILNIRNAPTAPGGLLAPSPSAAGTVGDLKNVATRFEGALPHEFTPSQWHRYGKQHGVDNLGPADEAAWEKSLTPIQTTDGRTVTIPGGIDSKEPFTYYDLLHIKQQGINPNALDPAVHQKIHDRIVKTMSPQNVELTPERIFNQLALAQISPNQPLTPNELAVARVMAKGPEDLDKIGSMIPWSYKDKGAGKAQMKDPKTGQPMTYKATDKKTGKITVKPLSERKYYNDLIARKLGLGAASSGGLGARGTADYTRIAETAQRIRANPDFFKFRGTGEGGKTNAENWSNFVERLSSQTPGLSAKTGSFGAVWQNPAAADISAVDRHMAGLFTKEMFPSPKDYDAFTAKHVAAYNKTAKKKVTSFNQIPDKQRNDMMFGYLNTHPEMVYRGKPAKGSNSGEGLINPRVPQHLRPDDAQWVYEPERVSLISEPYQRVLGANAERANKAGQSTFASQWMLWDRIRNRLEPHEIMFPGLEKLPRMSMDEMHAARKDLSEAGYMSGTKDIDEVTGEPLGLQPVRPLPSASRAGYFGIPLAVGAGAGVLAGGGGEAQAAPAAPAPRSPIAALDSRVQEEARATGSSPRDILKRMLGLQ